MQNRTDYAGLPIRDRLRQTAGQYRRALEMAAAAAGGAVFAGAHILGGIAPFGVALAAAVPEGLFLPALFGALFGYLWFPAPGSAMEYAAAILLLGGVRWTLSSGSLWKRVPQAPAVLAGGCMLVGGVAAAFALGGDPYRLLMAVAVSMLAAGSAWFFARSFVILRSRVASAYQEELGCLYVTFLLIAAGLGQVTAAGISAGRVLASAGVLLFAFAGGPASGAVLGVGAGLVALWRWARTPPSSWAVMPPAACWLGTANRFGAHFHGAVLSGGDGTGLGDLAILPDDADRSGGKPAGLPDRAGAAGQGGAVCPARTGECRRGDLRRADGSADGRRSGLPRRCGRSATPPGRYPGSWAACTCAVWKMCGSRPWILSAGNVPGGTGAGRVNSTRPWTP